MYTFAKACGKSVFYVLCAQDSGHVCFESDDSIRAIGDDSMN